VLRRLRASGADRPTYQPHRTNINAPVDLLT
jgi:hypothetical protein